MEQTKLIDLIDLCPEDEIGDLFNTYLEAEAARSSSKEPVKIFRHLVGNCATVIQSLLRPELQLTPEQQDIRRERLLFLFGMCLAQGQEIFPCFIDTDERKLDDYTKKNPVTVEWEDMLRRIHFHLSNLLFFVEPNAEITRDSIQLHADLLNLGYHYIQNTELPEDFIQWLCLPEPNMFISGRDGLIGEELRKLVNTTNLASRKDENIDPPEKLLELCLNQIQQYLDLERTQTGTILETTYINLLKFIAMALAQIDSMTAFSPESAKWKGYIWAIHEILNTIPLESKTANIEEIQRVLQEGFVYVQENYMPQELLARLITPAKNNSAVSRTPTLDATAKARRIIMQGMNTSTEKGLATKHNLDPELVKKVRLAETIMHSIRHMMGHIQASVTEEALGQKDFFISSGKSLAIMLHQVHRFFPFNDPNYNKSWSDPLEENFFSMIMGMIEMMEIFGMDAEEIDEGIEEFIDKLHSEFNRLCHRYKKTPFEDTIDFVLLFERSQEIYNTRLAKKRMTRSSVRELMEG